MTLIGKICKRYYGKRKGSSGFSYCVTTEVRPLHFRRNAHYQKRRTDTTVDTNAYQAHLDKIEKGILEERTQTNARTNNERQGRGGGGARRDSWLGLSRVTRAKQRRIPGTHDSDDPHLRLLCFTKPSVKEPHVKTTAHTLARRGTLARDDTIHSTSQ